MAQTGLVLVAPQRPDPYLFMICGDENQYFVDHYYVTYLIGWAVIELTDSDHPVTTSHHSLTPANSCLHSPMSLSCLMTLTKSGPH